MTSLDPQYLDVADVEPSGDGDAASRTDPSTDPGVGDDVGHGPGTASAADDGSPRRTPGRLVPRTLTARLVLGVVVLVALIVAATGTATYVTLHRFLAERLDQQLLDTADSGRVLALVNGDGDGDGRGLYGPQRVWLAILDTKGAVAATAQGGSKSMVLDSVTRAELTGPHDRLMSVTSTGGEHLRVTTVSGLATRTQPPVPVVVVVGLSESDMRETLRNLLRLESAIGAGAVLLAFGLTAGGMSLGLRPLKRVTRTAQEVSTELAPDGAGLDRRVPDTGSATEVGQLATSFNAMLDTVQHEFSARRESEERMRQFLADASHELRTPLTSIRGYAELARLRANRRRAAAPEQTTADSGSATSDAATTDADPRDDGAEAAAEYADTLSRIETEGTRMSRLVEDLLTLARGDDRAHNEEAPVHQPVAFSDAVADAVDSVRVAHPRRVLVVELEPDLWVSGDQDQLLRVVRNLAGNAAVHTDPVGPVRVSARREGDTVVLQVADRGPGLDPADAAHVFERFWRADRARTRVRGGSGLGLAIVEQLVEAHDGQVHFDSTVAGGTTVTVVLPALAGDATAEDSQAST
ncbi:MAG: HAMP domain-containing sensor histidine kinase [bacterium]